MDSKDEHEEHGQPLTPVNSISLDLLHEVDSNDFGVDIALSSFIQLKFPNRENFDSDLNFNYMNNVIIIMDNCVGQNKYLNLNNMNNVIIIMDNSVGQNKLQTYRIN